MRFIQWINIEAITNNEEVLYELLENYFRNIMLNKKKQEAEYWV